MEDETDLDGPFPNGDRSSPDFIARVALKKTKYLTELVKADLNKYQAALAIGVSRGTITNWEMTDENFKDAVDEIMEILLDKAESVLFQEMANPLGRSDASKFILRYKGRSRGYEGSTNILLAGDKKAPLSFIFADAPKPTTDPAVE